MSKYPFDQVKPIVLPLPDRYVTVLHLASDGRGVASRHTCANISPKVVSYRGGAVFVAEHAYRHLWVMKRFFTVCLQNLKNASVCTLCYHEKRNRSVASPRLLFHQLRVHGACIFSFLRGRSHHGARSTAFRRTFPGSLNFKYPCVDVSVRAFTRARFVLLEQVSLALIRSLYLARNSPWTESEGSEIGDEDVAAQSQQDGYQNVENTHVHDSVFWDAEAAESAASVRRQHLPCSTSHSVVYCYAHCGRTARQFPPSVIGVASVLLVLLSCWCC